MTSDIMAALEYDYFKVSEGHFEMLAIRNVIKGIIMTKWKTLFGISKEILCNLLFRIQVIHPLCR